jgi:hypothetical protein
VLILEPSKNQMLMDNTSGANNEIALYNVLTIMRVEDAIRSELCPVEELIMIITTNI